MCDHNAVARGGGRHPASGLQFAELNGDCAAQSAWLLVSARIVVCLEARLKFFDRRQEAHKLLR